MQIPIQERYRYRTVPYIGTREIQEEADADTDTRDIQIQESYKCRYKIDVDTVQIQIPIQEVQNRKIMKPIQ
jgi:hypothetical protein